MNASLLFKAPEHDLSDMFLQLCDDKGPTPFIVQNGWIYKLLSIWHFFFMLGKFRRI